MSKTVKLYHVTYPHFKWDDSNFRFEEDRDAINNICDNGLSPEYSGTAVGGQASGIYFFCRKNWVKDWILRNRETEGDEGFICTAAVPKSEITFPNWRLDIFFNQSIIDTLASSLKQFYKHQVDGNGIVPLKLKSQYARVEFSPDEDGYFEEVKGEITGLKFKNNQCFVLFKEEEGRKKSLSVHLSSVMNTDYYGLADTLIGDLCQKDASFLKRYNKKLKQNIANEFQMGAIKYTGPNNIPVKVEPYDLLKDPLYIISGLLLFSRLVGVYTDLKEKPLHKRIPKIAKDLLKEYQDRKKYGF